MSNNKKLEEILRVKLGGKVLSLSSHLGDLVLVIDRKSHKEVFSILRTDPGLNFEYLSNITAVDWLDRKDDRFEVVYHLMNLDLFYRLRVKVAVPESDPSIDSVLSIWASADFMESEVWDMFGISFKGHPDLRRMLMYPEFEGHPLRKDYPVQGKQPRVPMRAPEVRNTASDMIRPELVQIGKSKSDMRLEK